MDLQVTDVRSFVPAKDFEQSKAFYQALGWQLAWSDGSLALLANGGQRFYLQNYYVKEWADNAMLHMTVADAQSAYEQICELLAGGGFPEVRAAPPKEESYGALVTYVWDPAGVLLHFAQWLRT